MHVMDRAIFQFFLLLILTTTLYAQKTEKGSSANNPWNREIDDGQRIFKGKNDPNDMFSELSFGEWSFKSAFPLARTVSEISHADPGWFRNMDKICCLPYSARLAMFYVNDSIHTFASTPGKLSFQMNFSFADSVFEQYYIRWFKTEYEKHMHFYRKLRGQVISRDEVTFSFSLGIYFNDSIDQPLSYIHSETDTIYLKPVFDPKIKELERDGAFGSSYDGFEFYRNDQLIGGARRYLDWSDYVRYKYWFSPALDKKYQEAVASMIYVIVGFIK
jgi:hypothetical protein